MASKWFINDVMQNLINRYSSKCFFFNKGQMCKYQGLKKIPWPEYLLNFSVLTIPEKKTTIAW